MKRNLVLPNGWIVEEVEPSRWRMADPMSGGSMDLPRREAEILVAAWKAGGQELDALVAPQLKRLCAEVEQAHQEHARAVQRAYRWGALAATVSCTLGMLLARYITA